MVVWIFNLNLEVRPSKLSLTPYYDESILNNLRENELFESEPSLGQEHFQIRDSMCTAKHKLATFGTTCVFKSVKRLRLNSATERNGNRNAPTVLTARVPRGSNYNLTFYLQVLAALRERVCKNQPELETPQSWILHQDSPAHNALSVRRCCLATRSPTVVEHEFYSPDCDFFRNRVCFNRNPVWVNGRAQAQIGRAPNALTILQMTTFDIALVNGTLCGEERGVHWREAFDCRIVVKIKLIFSISLVI